MFSISSQDFNQGDLKAFHVRGFITLVDRLKGAGSGMGLSGGGGSAAGGGVGSAGGLGSAGVTRSSAVPGGVLSDDGEGG